MKDHPRGFLALIPARGGSKGIPGKNIRPFLGRPLLAWTAEVARSSGVFDRVILSTEEPEIAEIGRSLGLEVPFLRPAELATDTAPTSAVVRHAVQWLAERESWKPRWVMVLEPTSPARRAVHIVEAAALLERSGADSLASVSEVPHHYVTPKVLELRADGSLVGAEGLALKDMVHRRQELPKQYALNGLLYACKAECVLKDPPSLWGERVVGYVVDSRYAVDLDRPEDWGPAEARVRDILALQDGTGMREIRFGRIRIAEETPAVVIAEAACEHLGSLEVAKRMVEAAYEAGADIIKFQLHLPEEMIPGSIRFWGGSMDEVLAKYNLSVSDHKALAAHCEQVGIQYLCTPFCAKAADHLEELGVAAFKTGSGEMTNLPMLRHIARKGKPMIVSTGMATMEEISETVAALRNEKSNFILMNCTSAYPPRYDQVNLRLIPALAERFGVFVGHSDHTPDLWTALGAVALGAKVIEKHFTLDRGLKGPDWHVSLEPSELKILVDGVRKLERALGAEKKVYDEERVVRDWAHHSVVTLRPIRAGEVLAPGMLGVKRPGRGVSAKHLEDFYGRTARRDLPADALVQWEDVAAGAAETGERKRA